MHRVSILTRPGGRVQLRHEFGYVSDKKVSILTRPGGRVQQLHTNATIQDYRFNPHPSRRTGATRPARELSSLLLSGFNPHPSRRTGAT